ncbi:hypothetical protein [Mycolicibacterium pulveris]|uniref:hypothetical protein n=1 Tax=Mycolicibacterium pulveris TaxID=36813 RepID=UPI001C657531|nr:hypothetical protein [Mycolicibacterium pulveris]
MLISPTGHTYPSAAHGASLFPALGQDTGELDLPTEPVPPDPNRLAKLPRRKRTRDRINAERRQRQELIAEQQRQRQAWLTENEEPPPF